MASLRHGDHDCGAHNCEGQSLYKFIDHPGVRCLNAAEGSDARAVLRPWERRRERTPVLESNEDDCELLLYVPFTCDVKLSGLVVSGGGGGSSPTSMRAFVNRADVDFALAAELPAAGSWTLAEDAEASLEYPTRGRAFAVVSSVTLYFPANGGAPTQQLCFVGLRGTGDASVSRELASNIVYESAPQPADHKVGAFGGLEARLGQ